MSTVHFFDAPDRFVAGTVGAPGQRAFFLQARSGSRTVSVGCEKQQVQILAERADELLDQVRLGLEQESMIPARAPEELRDDGPLEFPISEEFRAGTMTLGWSADAEVLVLEVFSSDVLQGDLVELLEEAGEDDSRQLLVVHLTAARARAFAERARLVVAGGRPDCPFCAEPVDPEGHLCVRANGFRRREP